MEEKEAIKILLKMIDKYSLNGEEKDSILEAIGLFDMADLSKKILKRRAEFKKEKKKKDAEW